MADRNDAVTMSLEEAKILVMRGMAGQSPRINPTNNHWEVYDNESGAWKDTGVDASGNIDITGDNQLVFLNYDGDTTLITDAETGEPITAAQIGALTTQGKMSFLYVDTDSPEWLAFNGWFPNSGEAVFDNDRLHAVVTTNLQTLVTTGLVTVKPWLPKVTTADAGKILKVDEYGVWSKGDASAELPSLDPDGADANKLLGVDEQGEEYKLVSRPEGVPSYESSNVGSVLKLYRPSANSGNSMTWESPAYPILVYKNGNNYTVHSAVTAENVVANKGNLVIILNGSVQYNCVGALTSDFHYGHFYFVAAKPTDSAIETEWLDLDFFTGENGSVSVTPVSFDIKGTKWLNVQYDLSTDSYTPNFTAADVANSLPNAVLALDERRYSPVGWEIDDGLLVNATFARATYDSNGYAGLDCFKVNNSGGSFTVRRYTIPANDTFEIPVTRTNGTYTTTVSAADIIAHRKSLAVVGTNFGTVLTCDGASFSGFNAMTFYFSSRQIDYSSNTEYIHSMTIQANTIGGDTVTITNKFYTTALTSN